MELIGAILLTLGKQLRTQQHTEDIMTKAEKYDKLLEALTEANRLLNELDLDYQETLSDIQDYVALEFRVDEEAA